MADDSFWDLPNEAQCALCGVTVYRRSVPNGGESARCDDLLGIQALCPGCWEDFKPEAITLLTARMERKRPAREGRTVVATYAVIERSQAQPNLHIVLLTTDDHLLAHRLARQLAQETGLLISVDPDPPGTY